MMTCDEARMSLGVLALGALEPDEVVLVEAHLAECETCRAEYGELVGVSALLGRASEEEVLQAAAPPRAVLDRLLNAKVKRRRRARVLLAVAASAAVIVAGGAVVSSIDSGAGRPPAASDTAAESAAARNGTAEGQTLAREPKAPAVADGSSAAPLAAAPDLRLVGQNGKIRGQVELYAGASGSAVQVKLSGVRTGTHCTLVAVGSNGTKDEASSWQVSAAQYGETAAFGGNTSFAPDQIERFEIVTSDGELLVSLLPER